MFFGSLHALSRSLVPLLALSFSFLDRDHHLSALRCPLLLSSVEVRGKKESTSSLRPSLRACSARSGSSLEGERLLLLRSATAPRGVDS